MYLKLKIANGIIKMVILFVVGEFMVALIERETCERKETKITTQNQQIRIHWLRKIGWVGSLVIRHFQSIYIDYALSDEVDNLLFTDLSRTRH